MEQKKKNIVCIGGGSGMPTVLRALASSSEAERVNLTAVVTMADNGGSAGMLRKQYGSLPTGDVRRALAALANTDSPLRDLMTYRFKGGLLNEQSAGSLFLTSLENVAGSYEKAIDAAAKLLNIRGEVLPVTLDSTQLYAQLSDGSMIMGETDIDIPKHDPKLSITKLWLEPEAQINPRVKTAIMQAEMIIVGPGDLYTSLVPNLLVMGVCEAINASGAKKVYLANLMTKYGETQSFKAEDFLKEIEKYISVDVAVFNNHKPQEKILAKYRSENAEFVEPPAEQTTHTGIKYVLADLLAEGDVVRHDAGDKLSHVILAL